MKDSRVPSASPRERKGAEAEWKMITQFSKQIPGSSVSSANHRPKCAVCLSPFVWSFLGSEPCSDRIVLQPVCTLVYKTICSRWPWSSCRPLLEPLRQERSSWGCPSFSKHFPTWDFFCPQVCAHIHIYIPFVLSWEVWYIHTLFLRVSYLLKLVPPVLLLSSGNTRAGFI